MWFIHLRNKYIAEIPMNLNINTYCINFLLWVIFSRECVIIYVLKSLHSTTKINLLFLVFQFVIWYYFNGCLYIYSITFSQSAWLLKRSGNVQVQDQPSRNQQTDIIFPTISSAVYRSCFHQTCVLFRSCFPANLWISSRCQAVIKHSLCYRGLTWAVLWARRTQRSATIPTALFPANHMTMSYSEENG